jgi:hypothetical protein
VLEFLFVARGSEYVLSGEVMLMLLYTGFFEHLKHYDWVGGFAPERCFWQFYVYLMDVCRWLLREMC